VQEHRDDLVYLLRNGEPYVRGLALYVLLEGADKNEWELVEREVQLAQQIGDDVLEGVKG
jgi:HEAT repeat protein